MSFQTVFIIAYNIVAKVLNDGPRQFLKSRYGPSLKKLGAPDRFLVIGQPRRNKSNQLSKPESYTLFLFNISFTLFFFRL